MSMIAEGTPPSSSSPQPAVPGGGPPRPDEPDLLAERRARRAAETGEHALLLRAEAAEATVKTLESHILTLQQRLVDAEGNQRRTAELVERLERVEDALQAIRESHRRMALTVGELKDVAIRLRAAAGHEPTQSPAAPRRDEMTDALAAAVERLRARAQETVAGASPGAAGPARSSADASAPVVPPSTLAPSAASAAPTRPKPHKHSMSLIGRLRYARKQRREGR